MKYQINNKGFTRTQNSTKSGFFNFFNNHKSKFKQNSSERVNLVGGFTLVETLVAVAIFASAITALISITARGINDNVFVKNKLIAGYLAQEGVELVVNIRDSNAVDLGAIAGVAWSSFLTEVRDCYTPNIDSVEFPKTCMIDGSNPPSFFIQSCSNGDCLPLRYNPSLGVYGYSGIEESPFTRSISILSVPANNPASSEVFIKSEVSWKQGNRTHSTSYYYNLFDWFSE